MKLTKQQMIDRAAALKQQATGTQTRSALAQAISATQQQIKLIESKGDNKTLADVRLLKTLRTRSDQQNDFKRQLDDADVARAKEKMRSRRARKVETINVNDPSVTRAELRDASLEVLERDGQHLLPAQQDAMDALIRSDYTDDLNPVEICKRTITTQAPAYISAFRKAMQPGHNFFTPEEAAAVTAYRAAAESPTSAGGFGVPVLVDPTIIVSAGASAAPVMQLATTIVVTTDKWAGVTAAAPSWAWKGEAAVAGESDPTLAQPTIPVYTADGYIQASYELAADYPNFAAEMQSILAAGYVDMVANATITGSGSSQPYGVFVRMVNTTTSPTHIVCTTAGTLGAVDVRAAWKALPQRARTNATWLASGAVGTLVKNFAAGASEVDYAQTLTQDGTRIAALEGRPFVTSDYCPAFSGTTSGAPGITGAACVVGDFANGMRVISRAGLNVEVVQNVPNFGGSSNVPIMSRGLYATARVGWDIVVPDFFRVIADA